MRKQRVENDKNSAGKCLSWRSRRNQGEEMKEIGKKFKRESFARINAPSMQHHGRGAEDAASSRWLLYQRSL